MNNQEAIKSALESLHNPEVYNQALTDCKSLLNLSVDTLLAHFLTWLWHEDVAIPEYDAGEFQYYLELAKIEEHLTLEGLIYQD